MGLLLTNSPAGWESPFWDSFTPVLVMAGVAVVVGVFCYADFCDQPVGNRDRRVFRPFYWCLGLVVVAVPLMYAAGMAAFVLYFEF